MGFQWFVKLLQYDFSDTDVVEPKQKWIFYCYLFDWQHFPRPSQWSSCFLISHRFLFSLQQNCHVHSKLYPILCEKKENKIWLLEWKKWRNWRTWIFSDKELFFSNPPSFRTNEENCAYTQCFSSFHLSAIPDRDSWYVYERVYTICEPRDRLRTRRRRTIKTIWWIILAAL